MADVVPARYQPPLPSQEFLLTDKPDEEAVPMDVVFVGAGPAGLAGAIELARLVKQDGESGGSLGEIEIAGMNLGRVVEELTRGRVPATWRAHLDPDLAREARPRRRGWKPLFGQCAAAQGVLRRQGVGPGDLFLFFGWFREAETVEGGLRFRPGAPDLHVLFGWLEVARVLSVERDPVPAWADGHPHLSEVARAANTLYVGKEGGPFRRYHDRLRLTASDESRSVWRLPGWFFPTGDRPPLSSHDKDLTRWSRTGDATLLRSVPRGQEFVLDCEHYPEAAPWARGVVRNARSG